ncbi:hypothetical protein O6H91_Y359200 [Diphasiastrum complanatum]|nr:hypothetical protein O6H91_Y359200 [Diphasiastrum complanatum]
MATERSNTASIKLFTSKLGYKKFREPRILVHPVFLHSELVPPNVRVTRLTKRDAITLYTYLMGTAEFFPKDIEKILKNDLYEGTWIAALKEEEDFELINVSEDSNSGNGGSELAQNLLKGVVKSWAMVSLWKCNEIFKLQVEGVSLKIRTFAAITRFVDQALPWLKIPSFPDVFSPFGMQFMFGVHAEGVKGHELLRSLCGHARNIARRHNCQVIMTELASSDPLADCIPQWKCLSSADDLWCIKRLRNQALDRKMKTSDSDNESSFESFNWCKSAEEEKLFVDPRDV